MSRMKMKHYERGSFSWYGNTSSQTEPPYYEIFLNPEISQIENIEDKLVKSELPIHY